MHTYTRDYRRCVLSLVRQQEIWGTRDQRVRRIWFGQAVAKSSENIFWIIIWCFRVRWRRVHLYPLLENPECINVFHIMESYYHNMLLQAIVLNSSLDDFMSNIIWEHATVDKNFHFSIIIILYGTVGFIIYSEIIIIDNTYYVRMRNVCKFRCFSSCNSYGSVNSVRSKHRAIDWRILIKRFSETTTVDCLCMCVPLWVRHCANDWEEHVFFFNVQTAKYLFTFLTS